MAINSFSELEDKIKSDYPDGLRLMGFLKKDKPKDYKTFIKKFLLKYRKEYKTINPKTREMICDVKRRRSFGEIFLITRYYYPRCKIHNVFNELKELCVTTHGFRSSYCTVIKDRVFYYMPIMSNIIYNGNFEDKYGLLWKSYERMAAEVE